jgi:hypothetical protein
MPVAWNELSAFTVFLLIAGAGFVFLLISLIFGEIFEHFDADHDSGGPGFFSTRVISVFVTAFGGTGAVAVQYGASVLGASVAGGGQWIGLRVDHLRVCPFPV